LTLLWAGRLERRKALPLALEALAQLEPEINVRLLVAGDGPQRAECTALASRLGVENRIEFLGMLPRQEMPKVFQQADAFLFTSLRDAFGSVILEAAGYGLPIIALDHQGAGQFVPSAAAIKVPVTRPSETVSALANGIRILAGSPELRRRMSAAARAFAETQHWDRRAEQMELWYEKVVHSKSQLLVTS
jgi:glycosyltransferase involved in cell wall biosynthesis